MLAANEKCQCQRIQRGTGCQRVVRAGSGRPGWAAGRGADGTAVLSSLTLPMSPVQAAMEIHLEQRLYQPQKLLEDLRETDAQQFRTAMKCLLEDKKERVVRLWAPGSRRRPGPVGTDCAEANRTGSGTALHLSVSKPPAALGPSFFSLSPKFKGRGL